MMFWVFVLSMGAGGITLQIQVYLIFCITLALVIVSMICARLARVPLEIRCDLPLRTTAGARVEIPIELHNPTKHTAMDVAIHHWQLPRRIKVSYPQGERVARLAPGEACVVPHTLEFVARGAYKLNGWRQETYYPWGIWKDLLNHPGEHGMLVYPKFHPLTTLDIPVGSRYQPGGISLSSNIGESVEFIGTREFRQGDTLRAIHWKTWARLGKPAVKEFQEEYFCRIALLMDTFIPQEKMREARAAFEAAISTAAAIADRLSHEEYVIDIFAAGPEIYHLQAGRSLAYLENVLDILACLDPCHEAPFEKISPILVDNLESITTTICVMLDWDERREKMCRVIRDHGSEVKVVVVRDGPTSADVSGVEAHFGRVAVLSSEDVRNGVEDL
jgi:uncharacterized protein (DUF58 family)